MPFCCNIEHLNPTLDWPGVSASLVFFIADLIKYAATPPNQPQQCILTDYFNNYNFLSPGATTPIGDCILQSSSGL